MFVFKLWVKCIELGLLVVVFVVLVLLGVGIGWGVYGNICFLLDFILDFGVKFDGIVFVVLILFR